MTSMKRGVLQPITPTFDYLPWQITHSLYVYIQSLTTMSGSQFFGSVVRALDFYLGGLGLDPMEGGKFFQLCFISLYCNFHVVRTEIQIMQFYYHFQA